MTRSHRCWPGGGATRMRQHGRVASVAAASAFAGRASLAFVLAAVSSSLVGCGSVVGPDGPDVTITLEVDAAATAPLHFVVRIAGSQFGIDSAGSISVRAPHAGDLPVDVQLLSESGETLAAASLTHSFADGFDNWIYAKVGGSRPVGLCIGRLTVVPVDAPVSDTLFLMDGSLPKGAIC
jgi:hypothetical protein